MLAALFRSLSTTRSFLSHQQHIGMGLSSRPLTISIACTHAEREEAAKAETGDASNGQGSRRIIDIDVDMNSFSLLVPNCACANQEEQIKGLAQSLEGCALGSQTHAHSSSFMITAPTLFFFSLSYTL